MTYYDPPSGWQFGFPKVYAPLPGETLEETLLRDGYPKRLMDLAMRATRFWESGGQMTSPAVLTDRSRIKAAELCPRLRAYEYEWEGTGVDLGGGRELDMGSCFHAAAEATLTPVVGAVLGHEFFTPNRLAAALVAAHAAPEWGRVAEEDRPVVDALVRTWWVAGLPEFVGWRVLECEREELFEYPTTLSVPQRDDADDVVIVRMMSRLDLLTEAPVGATLKGLPVAPGEYIVNWKTARSLNDRWRQKWTYDSQVITELLGVEARLGHRTNGVIVQGVQKEDNPLLGGWRSQADPTMVQARRWWKCDSPHQNTHTKRKDMCPGGKTHRLGDDFQFVSADELGGAEEWFRRLSAEDPYLIKEFVETMRPLRPTDFQVESWKRQKLPREAAYAAVRSPEPLDWEALDRHFPQHTDNCRAFGRPCPAHDICWGALDPSTLPQRIPNHPMEGEKDADTN